MREAGESHVRPVLADGALSLIGRTPLVRLARVSPGGREILGKLESMNPAGSVKDRIALSMVEAAEREGRLRPGETIVEPTSASRWSAPARATGSC